MIYLHTFLKLPTLNSLAAPPLSGWQPLSTFPRHRYQPQGPVYHRSVGCDLTSTCGPWWLGHQLRVRGYIIYNVNRQPPILGYHVSHPSATWGTPTRFKRPRLGSEPQALQRYQRVVGWWNGDQT